MDKNQLEYWAEEIKSSVIGNYERMGSKDKESQQEELGALDLIISFALIGLSVCENAPPK